MINEIQNLLDRYIVWLKDKSVLRQIQDSIELTTPYLDRHNDYLQIYIKKDNGNYILSDDGYTLNDLRISGCDLKTKKRKELLKLTLNGFGVKINNDEIYVHASSENFSFRKHNLLQAMLAINDMFYLAYPVVSSLFFEDVMSWLNIYEVRFTPQVKFAGKSGYDHMFDFVIPSSRKYPERIVQAINNPKRESIQAFAFSWIDTRETRPIDSMAYAILNDSDFSPTTNVIEALDNYGIKPVLWSQRELMKENVQA